MSRGSLAASGVFIALASSAASAQVLHSGPSVFGSAYANFGLGGRDSWEIYRKNSGGATVSVVGAAVAGNNTLATFTDQQLGANGAFSDFRATGQTFLGKSLATTPATDMLYLKDLIQSNPTTPRPAGYDANGHGAIDIRIGFLADGSDYIAARGGDNTDTDLFGGNRGTNGIYLHLFAVNGGATTAGQPGNNWAVGIRDGAYAFNPTTPEENNAAVTPLPANAALIGGGTPTFIPSLAASDAGVGYDGALEVSATLVADPNVAGNVLIRAKLGNNVITSSFDPDGGAFSSSPFDWQNATPIVFTGKGGFDYPVTDFSATAGTARIGVLAPGDANANGSVNIADVNTLRSNFGGPNKTWSQGDFNQNGTVTIADVNTARTHFGAPVSLVAALTTASSAIVASSAPSTLLVTPAAGEVQLVVDITTGEVMLVGGTGASVSSYQIDSADGSLNAADPPAGWNSLTEQGLSGFSEFSRLDTSVAEATFGNGPSLNNLSISLGFAFDVGGTQNLLFTAFNNAGDQVGFDADVIYVSSAVPEPASIVGLAVGGIAMMLRRRVRPALAAAS